MATLVRGSLREDPARVDAAAVPVPSALFQALSVAELEELFASGTKYWARRHQVLYCAGEELTQRYFVQSGSLKLVRHSQEGKELIVSLVGPGECCRPFAEPYEAASLAQALEDTEYTLLPLTAIRRAMSRNPRLAVNLLAYTQMIHLEAEAATARLTFQSVPQRLAHLLAVETNEPTGSLTFPLNQTEIANLIGSSRETVCSLLNQFQRQGLIRIDRGQVRVLRRSGLAATQ